MSVAEDDSPCGIIDFLIGLIILLILYGAIIAFYLACGAVIGIVCAGIAYYWPFGNAASSEMAMFIGIVMSLIGALICWTEHFPL